MSGRDSVEPVINGYKPYEGNTIAVKYYHPSANYVTAVIWDVMKALRNGKRVVCCVSSKSLGRTIKDKTKELVGEENIKLYHGDQYEKDESGRLHKHEKAEDFKDVVGCWKSKWLLIYTGTLSVGVDYSPENDEDRFDTFINVFQHNCGTANQFIQSFAWCRSFKDKKHILYINHKTSSKIKPITAAKQWDLIE